MNRRESPPLRFSTVARVFHWLLAALILSMLFIGAGMVATVSERHDQLFAIHKPVGVAVLLLAALRLLWRLTHRPPALPEGLPRMQAFAAIGSHALLYVLMFTVPLAGWATLSAGGYPVALFGSFVLPPIAPVDAGVFAVLRPLHRWLAYFLFATVLLHLAAALHHGLVRRDGVLASMLGWERSRSA